VCSAEADILAFARVHQFEFVATPNELRRADGSLVQSLVTDEAAPGSWVEQVWAALALSAQD
jgi:hypothetical protein